MKASRAQRKGEPICMKEMFFWVDDEDELRDMVWDYYWKDVLDGAALRIKEMESVVPKNYQRLFKVWIEKSYISCNPTSSSIVYTVPYQMSDEERWNIEC